MAAPQTLDILARFTADNFDESLLLNEPTAFQSWFGRPGMQNFNHFSPNANAADIEITRADERLPALVPRGTLSGFLGTNFAMGEEGKQTYFSRKFPLMVEEFPITAEMLNNRLPYGELPFENLTPEVRLQRYSLRGYRIMLQRLIRGFEVLAVESITLGKQQAQGALPSTPGANDFDWRRNSANTVSLTHGWGYSGTTPLTDIDSACFQLRAAGKVNPDMMILGATALTDFLFNASIQGAATATGGYASHIYWDFVQFNMNFLPDPKFARFIKGGLEPVGKLRTPGGFTLTLFVYPQGYTAANGTWTKYLNDAYATIASTSARCDRYFGPPEQLPLTQMDQQRLMERFGFNPLLPPIPRNDWMDSDVVIPQMFYVDAYENGNRTVVTPRVQTAPIFPTTQTDAFLTITNAGTSS